MASVFVRVPQSIVDLVCVAAQRSAAHEDGDLSSSHGASEAPSITKRAQRRELSRPHDPAPNSFNTRQQARRNQLEVRAGSEGNG
jgi:hypothetical protein